jgi:hypothetical protein
VAFSPKGERVLLGSGPYFFPYFCDIRNLDKTGYIAPLTTQQRIENGLMKEADCSASTDAAELAGCAKYFLKKNFGTYKLSRYDPENIRTALQLATKSAALDPQGEGVVIERNIRKLMEEGK